MHVKPVLLSSHTHKLVSDAIVAKRLAYFARSTNDERNKDMCPGVCQVLSSSFNIQALASNAAEGVEVISRERHGDEPMRS